MVDLRVQVDRNAGPRVQVDEAVCGELLDLEVYEMGNLRLRDAEEVRRLMLHHATCLDEPAQADHQLRSDSEVLRMIRLALHVRHRIKTGFSERLNGSMASPLQCIFVSAGHIVRFFSGCAPCLDGLQVHGETVGCADRPRSFGADPGDVLPMGT